MNIKRCRRWVKWGRWLPALVVFQQLGCLPDQAIQQVAVENILLTSAIIIQSITSIIFNNIFGVI